MNRMKWKKGWHWSVIRLIRPLLYVSEIIPDLERGLLLLPNGKCNFPAGHVIVKEKNIREKTKRITTVLNCSITSGS